MTSTGTPETTTPEHDAPESVVVREGASLRTADELVIQYVIDARDLGAELSPYGTEALSRLSLALAAEYDACMSSWFSDREDADEARMLASQVETDLCTLGLVTTWDDGYTIRPECPVCHDEDGAHDY